MTDDYWYIFVDMAEKLKPIIRNAEEGPFLDYYDSYLWLLWTSVLEACVEMRKMLLHVSELIINAAFIFTVCTFRIWQ